MSPMKIVDRLFNWKKHPASVFFIAIPLAVLGFGSAILAGVLVFIETGDPVRLIIIFAALVMVFAALWPIRKSLLQQLRGK